MVATLKALKTYREPKMSEAGASAASSTLVANCERQHVRYLQGVSRFLPVAHHSMRTYCSSCPLTLCQHW